MKKKHPEKQRRQTPLMEELEPRILMSASLEGLLADDNLNLNDNNYTQSAEHLVITENEIVAAEADDNIRRELVIVDTDTPDFQLLLDDLLNQQTSERQFDVLLLDNNQNGIDQITAALGNYQNLNAIHIVSDGNNGNIDLGNTTLSYNNIDVYSGDIASWSNALAQDADILIYGCELASGNEGVNLIDSLSVLTGADIAASDDLTGATNLGGDWELEYQNGNIETQLAFSLEAQQSWSNILAIVDFSGTAYQSNGITNIGANATITLIVGGIDLGNVTTGSSGEFTFSDANVDLNETVLIYINSDGGTYQSTLVTEMNTLTDLTGLNLIDDTLTVRSDNGGTLTNAEMRAAEGGDGDSDILFSVDGSDNLTVEGLTTELHVAENQTYAPGGDINTEDMRIEGTFQGGSGSIYIDDDLLIDGGTFNATSATTYIADNFIISNGGTFTASDGTVVFNNTNNITINSGTSIFNNVEFSKGSATISITNDMDINGDLTITEVGQINDGTLSVSGNVTSNDGRVEGDATFIFDDGGPQTLQADDGGDAGLTGIIIDKTNGSTLTINGTVSLYGSTGFTYNTGNIVLSNDNTFLFTRPQTIEANSFVFNNVEIYMGNTSSTLTIDGNMDINGDLTITNVNEINGGTLSVAGDFISNDTGVSGSTNITLDGSGTQTIGGGGDISGNTLTINSDGVVNLTSALTLDTSGPNLTIEKGTLDLKGFTLAVNGALTVNANLQLQGNENVSFNSLLLGDGSDVIYNGTNGSYDVKNWAYEDLIINGAGAVFQLGACPRMKPQLAINS